MELILNISNFDLYSKRLGFYYKYHDKIGSYFGFFLSIFYVIVCLVLFIQQMIKALQRNELNVYDSTIYAQEMPSINITKDQLYFAFGLEEPLTSNRFIDERIYIPKVAFIEKVKVGDELVTVNTTQLPLEKCNETNFGSNYQHLFTKHELNNSYCLKDFNYNLNFAGGYKYEKFNYIRLRIYPCVNKTTDDNCRPQEEIDEYLGSGYFSILIKDFGLNPSNYTSPVVPTFQDLYTTIDKKIYRNYILNFGITEVHTDRGLINDNIERERYFQFRKELQTFSFRDEKEYYAGKSIILVQMKLDDALIIQKRYYTKISDIFSSIGGYMQLMNTVFLLIASLVNKLNFELQIINSIFNFDLKDNRIILKLHSLKDLNKNAEKIKKKNSIFSSKKSVQDKQSIGSGNKSNINLVIKEKDLSVSDLNISCNKINHEQKISGIKLDKTDNFNPSENQSINIYSQKSKMENKAKNNNLNLINKFNFDIIKTKEKENNKYTNEKINLNVLDYFCISKNSKRYQYILLYNKSNRFYRKKIDIVHVFSLLSFIEEYIKTEVLE